MVPDFFSFQIKTRCLFGPGQLEDLGDALEGLPARRYLVVTDRVLAGLGFVDRIRDALKGSEVEIGAVYDGVEPNSETSLVEAGAKLGKDSQCDGVLGLGGGSSMDTAKAIAILLAHEGSLLDFEGAQILPGPVAPLVAIPTTAGTGSEVTNVSVVFDQASQRKVTFLDDHLFPDLAVLDPDLTRNLPPRLAAATGMDAITHAVEAYIDLQHSPFSDALAQKALELLVPNLPKVVARGAQEDEARAAVLTGATLAGIAFTHSMVGVVHGMSHALGALHHCPHGEANAVMLTHGLRYNLEAAGDRIAHLARAFEVCPTGEPKADAEAVIRALEDLRAKLHELSGLPRNLSDLKVPSEGLEAVAEKAMEDGSMLYNPRPVEEAEVLELLRGAF